MDRVSSVQTPPAQEAPPLARKLRLLPLVGATYFMVAGGPYGLEDIIGKAGYGRALLLLLVVPLVWSLPTSMMVGELAAAIPEEGGYYRWVRRAFGPFWGFQNAWLSIAASVFDMALYPVTFVLYLSRIAPGWTEGYRGTLWALVVVAGCTLWNLRGARAVGASSLWLFALMASPFACLIGLGVWRGLTHHVPPAPLAANTSADLAGAVSVTLWNYMGWDNASTVAQEVEDPQRTYPRAMLLTAGLVALEYILPLCAVALAGIPAAEFSTGAWADAARQLGGPGLTGTLLALGVVLGGTLSGIGMFNALMMSYTRVPYALAGERLLPKAFTRTNAAGVPWLSVVVLAVAWGVAVNLSFERLISIDLVLYGAALLLEFVALVVLRIREPNLRRPYRLPGGTAGTVVAGLGPALLIGFAIWAARAERIAGLNALLFASIVGACGPLFYLVARALGRPRASRA